MSQTPATPIVAHTAGPWVITDERDRFHGGEVIRPIDRKHSPVAIVCDFNRYDRDAEREANARLIAAAPEMYQRLRDLRNFLNDFLESDPPGISGSRLEHEFQIQHDMTAELVAKAEGRS